MWAYIDAKHILLVHLNISLLSFSYRSRPLYCFGPYLPKKYVILRLIDIVKNSIFGL